ncbi:MAG: hypothetical protein NXI13_02425 [Proteobacteria bacterium]|nr:hypothetical protein [Pseudomonadota bacterium]
MEMRADIRPTAALLEAFRFVIDHRWPCLIRAVPIVIMTGFIAWLETNILARTEFFPLVMNEILYAIFAVYWHRYTLLEEDRLSPDFGLHFGIREIKFAAVMLLYVLVTYVLATAFLAAMGTGSASSILIFIIALGLAFLPIILMFPAIALDQPLRPGYFARRIFEIFLPLLGTVLLGIVAAVGLYLLIFLPLGLLAILMGTTFAEILVSVVASFLVMPLVLAVSVSFVSFLYRDMIGLAPQTA